MMNYEIFREVVTEKFKDYLPQEYQKMSLQVCQAKKVNTTLDGIYLFDKEGKSGISPTLYINEMYDHYKDTDDLQEVLQAAAGTMAGLMKEAPDILPKIDMKTAKDNVVFQLVNTEQNQSMLAEIPHREFQDLSIIYRWMLESGEEGIGSVLVNDQIAEQMGMTEEQLFMAAAQNTRNLMPPVVKEMSEMLCEMFIKDGMPAETAKAMVQEVPPDKSMYVITNRQNVNGATSMLYEEELHKLAESLGDDLYILPSSIHEVLAVPVSISGAPEEMADAVSEINMSCVCLEERLSNQVYHYDKDLRKLSLATAVPNRRLDGIEAEPTMVHETKQSR